MIRCADIDIPAAEVESVVNPDLCVRQSAVVLRHDPMLQEGVVAFICGSAQLGSCGQAVFDFCASALAYGKLPAWITCIDAPPMIPTQAHAPSSQDPASWPKMFDFRSTTKE
ncbi:hypothetical protein [Bradyrhizobium sp. RT3a]|uniref:hypothetical protein n=1 Tax=unclassified Bradyrhizobium TaxID=2631580 RepID=UPI0033981E32